MLSVTISTAAFTQTILTGVFACYMAIPPESCCLVSLAASKLPFGVRRSIRTMFKPPDIVPLLPKRAYGGIAVFVLELHLGNMRWDVTLARGSLLTWFGLSCSWNLGCRIASRMLICRLRTFHSPSTTALIIRKLPAAPIAMCSLPLGMNSTITGEMEESGRLLGSIKFAGDGRRPRAFCELGSEKSFILLFMMSVSGIINWEPKSRFTVLVREIAMPDASAAEIWDVPWL
jgi:hypothetical protein